MATNAVKSSTKTGILGIGTVAGTNVVSKSEATVAIKKTVIRLNAATVSITDNGSNGSGSLKIYDWPEGQITVLGAVANLTYAYTSATDAGMISSLGTAAAGADGTLSSTEADILGSTATAIATSAGTFAAGSALTPAYNGVSTAKDLYLNIATSNDPGASAAITATGDVTVLWVSAGDA